VCVCVCTGEQEIKHDCLKSIAVRRTSLSTVARDQRQLDHWETPRQTGKGQGGAPQRDWSRTARQHSSVTGLRIGGQRYIHDWTRSFGSICLLKESPLSNCHVFWVVILIHASRVKNNDQDWSKPVGYHVTLPCNKDQAGYRTFDAAFAVERGDGVTMDLVQVRLQCPSC
jgi:hypothetical protein